MSEFNALNGDMELHFTMHNNWEWILQAALEDFQRSGVGGYTSYSRYEQYKTMSDLPSQKRPPPIDMPYSKGTVVKKRKPTYSLFRFEGVVRSCDSGVKFGDCKRCCWMSAQTFGFIDPKDALYRLLFKAWTEDRDRSSRSSSSSGDDRVPRFPMPLTYLLPWDARSLSDLPEQLPSTPTSLLKASLGSGGFGIYFVQSPQQALDIIRRDADIARSTGNDGSNGSNSYFLESLRRDHGGRVPDWSLQQYINSVRVFADAQRCQFRVYVVYCDSHMYMYNSVEVRVPRWEGDDLDEFVYSQQAPEDREEHSDLGSCCSTTEPSVVAASRVREYNDGRDKQRTHRYVLSELANDFVSSSVGGSICPCDVVCKQSLLDTCRDALQLLRADIEKDTDSRRSILLDYACPYPRQEGTEAPMVLDAPPPTMMAIAGIDLLVDQHSLIPYIVEFNNNPAIPGSQKGMTDSYRQHLVSLMQDLLVLGGVLLPNDGRFSGPTNMEQLW